MKYKLIKGVALALMISTILITLSLGGCNGPPEEEEKEIIDFKDFDTYFETEYFMCAYDNDEVIIGGLTEAGQAQTELIIPRYINGFPTSIGVPRNYYESVVVDYFSDGKDNIKKIFMYDITFRNESVFKGLNCKYIFMSIYPIFGGVRFGGTENIYVPNLEPFHKNSSHIDYIEPANVSFMLNYENEYAGLDGFRIYDDKGKAKMILSIHWIDHIETGERIITIPPDPEREGYIFDGWYKEADCINQWDFNNDTMPNFEEEDLENEDIQQAQNININYDKSIWTFEYTPSDLLLYAKWTEIEE